MIRLLVLENDPDIRYGIYENFKSNYEVYVTKIENDVFNILNQTNINLIILDYSIISLKLKEFIDKLKEKNNKLLIMTLSNSLEDNDKKFLFNSNIDDYMSKPIDVLELQFRIERLLKKQSNQYRKLIKTDDLTINCETNTVVYCDNKLEFFNKEFQILYHLFSYPNRIFAKDELVNLICDNDYIINENTVRTYINNLRRKISNIEELDIVTVRGIGYKGVIRK